MAHDKRHSFSTYGLFAYEKFLLHLYSKLKFSFLNKMRALPLSLCIIAAFGAKNEECPNELASEECVEDCVTANTECILECEDGNCIRQG